MNARKERLIAALGLCLVSCFPGQSFSAESAPPAPTIPPPTPVQSPVVRIPAVPALPQGPSIDKILAWDATTKDVTVTNGVEAKYTFNVTNISSSEVIISNLLTSC